MSEKTKIQWCNSTVNFWSGCTKVSAGCAHCYAEALSKRAMADKHGNRIIGEWGYLAPRRLHESAFNLAERLNRKPWACNNCGAGRATLQQYSACCEFPDAAHRRRIFSLSLGDWLDPEVPIEWLARMLDTIRRCRDVNWMLPTKRPELFDKRLRDAQLHLIDVCKSIAASSHEKHEAAATAAWLSYWRCGEQVPQNVMVLASIENQASADERVPHLLRIPARWRGIIAEPLLGPVDLNDCGCGGAFRIPSTRGVCSLGIDLLIIGGESDVPKFRARPCHVDWVRDLSKQGERAGVARYVKQLGAHVIDDNAIGADQFPPEQCWPDGTRSEHKRILLRDRKGGDLSEWPEDLRVRQYPEGM